MHDYSDLLYAGLACVAAMVAGGVFGVLNSLGALMRNKRLTGEAMETLGTCSECGGPVQVRRVWSGIVPPTPACSKCGATVASQCASPHGPLIQTVPVRREVKPLWPLERSE